MRRFFLDWVVYLCDIFGFAKKIFGKGRNIALFIDGPNIIRPKEFKIDLQRVIKMLEPSGKVKIARVYLDQFASDKLIEAVVNQGYEPIISTGDVDTVLVAEAVETIFNPNIDIIALMTRDTDMLPVITKAKAHGKETIVIGLTSGFSKALSKIADKMIIYGEQV